MGEPDVGQQGFGAQKEAEVCVSLLRKGRESS